ncbi:MAG: AAA family ATPase [Burkholderiales bacterium]
MQAADAQRLLQRIAANIGSVMHGQHAQVRKLLAAFAAGGHVLVDDVPGTGKTTLAKALAASIGARFARVQFTPDLLPSDILGVSVFNQRDQSFEFREGPVFTSILLADEINRASPRTQSALLEVMAEGQVSVEGRTHAMDPMFFVVATQNPVEFRGTYPRPEAQMDRFALCLALGYVDADTEVAVLTAQDLGHPLERIGPVASRDEVLALKDAVRRVRVAEELKHYVVELVRRTRAAPQVLLGCGPRASIALTHTAKALALFDGEEFVRPEHVQALAVATLAHRMVLDPQARFAGASAASLVGDLLREVKVPA